MVGSGRDAEEQLWGRRLLACSLGRAQRRKCRTSYSDRMLGRRDCHELEKKKGLSATIRGEADVFFKQNACRARLLLAGWTHRPLLYS